MTSHIFDHNLTLLQSHKNECFNHISYIYCHKIQYPHPPISMTSYKDRVPHCAWSLHRHAARPREEIKRV